jgi:hypothetical protein
MTNEEWFKREYPDGKIDWERELERFHSVVCQHMDTLKEADKTKATVGIVMVALDVVSFMLELNKDKQ